MGFPLIFLNTDGSFCMYLIIGLFVFLLCYVLTPIVTRLAWRIGAVDVPLDGRRMHRRSIPRDGGVAIFLSFLVGLAVFNKWDAFLTAIAFGCGIMMLVGLADDIFGLGVWAKLLFQTATATAAVLGSGAVDGIWVAFAVLWVVLLINAHNFIDGMDGLLCGCGAIECLMLSACFFISGQGITGIATLYLMAACLAFRIYNRYPAHIFAGDCGSEALGFALGMLSLPLFGQGMHLSTLAPLFIFAYPVVDLFSSVVRRILHGYSPFRADRAHLHHRVFAAGISHAECTDILMSLTAVAGVLGVLISSEGLWLFAGILCPFAAWFLTSVKKYVLFSNH